MCSDSAQYALGAYDISTRPRLQAMCMLRTAVSGRSQYHQHGPSAAVSQLPSSSNVGRCRTQARGRMSAAVQDSRHVAGVGVLRRKVLLQVALPVGRGIGDVLGPVEAGASCQHVTHRLSTPLLILRQLVSQLHPQQHACDGTSPGFRPVRRAAVPKHVAQVVARSAGKSKRESSARAWHGQACVAAVLRGGRLDDLHSTSAAPLRLLHKCLSPALAL